MRKNSDKVYNHIGSIPIEKTKKMISLVPEGKNYKALPEEYQGIYKYHEAYHLLKFANEKQILEKAYAEYQERKRNNQWMN